MAKNPLKWDNYDYKISRNRLNTKQQLLQLKKKQFDLFCFSKKGK